MTLCKTCGAQIVAHVRECPTFATVTLANADEIIQRWLKREWAKAAQPQNVPPSNEFEKGRL